MDGSWMKANCQPTWQENHSDRESGGAGRAAWQCNGGEGHDCKQLGETNPRTDLRKRRKKKKTKWEKAASPPSLPPSPCFNRCAICSAKGGVAWTAKLLNRLCFDSLQKEGEVYFLSTRSVTPSNISVKKILHYGNFLAEYNVQMLQMDYLLQYGLRNRAAQRFCSFG